jgi:transcriptional regulator with XRE-family HTH domain
VAEELRQRLALARKKAGLSQPALARQLGLTAGAVGRWEAGFATPELKRLQRIAELLHVSADWLLSGAEHAPEVVVPLFGIVAAGSGAVIEPGLAEELVRVPPNIGAADYALRVKGDSMLPLIAEGDTVFCRTGGIHLPPFESDDLVQVPVERVEPYKNKICVVSINGEGYIKRLRIERQTQGMYLAHFASLNPTHTARSIGRTDDCRIQGVAVGLWREL